MADELKVALAADVGEAAWVRRPWCVWVAVGLVVLGAVLNVLFLFDRCPLDLSSDEAHYWLWSEHLDYGYYSKPPGIAWVIWGTVRVGAALGLNGDGSGAALMPVMRMAAVVMGFVSGLLSLFLARRIFRDDRVALGVIVLSAAVPMFAVGSLLITIDSPMYLCWAATAFCLWRAVEGGGTGGAAKWMYAAGVCAAAGMLFKPVLIALPVCAVIAAVADRKGGGLRRAFISVHGLIAVVIMLCSQIPVLLWNSRHGWVMFKHIGTQGFGGGGQKSFVKQFLLDPLSRMGEYVGGQAGGMGGIMFGLLVVAVVIAWRKARGTGGELMTPVRRTGWVFLLSFALPLWGFYFLMNLWKGTELNWPAASYFAGMILLAGVFVEGWNALDLKNRRTWRSWAIAAMALGVLLTAGAMNMHRLYPVAAEHLKPLEGKPEYAKSKWNPRNWVWDKPIMIKLRGMEERAEAVQKVREEMRAKTGEDPLIIAGRYDDASSLTFYLPGHPFVYSIMSNLGGRQSQYDIWPDLNETVGGQMKNAGRPAIIVGEYDEKVLHFESVGPPEQLEISVGGVVIKQVTIRRAMGFAGLEERKGGSF